MKFEQLKKIMRNTIINNCKKPKKTTKVRKKLQIKEELQLEDKTKQTKE